MSADIIYNFKTQNETIQCKRTCKMTSRYTQRAKRRTRNQSMR